MEKANRRKSSNHQIVYISQTNDDFLVPSIAEYRYKKTNAKELEKEHAQVQDQVKNFTKAWGK